MTSKTYIIGVDAGGTFTDAVILDSDNSSVLESVKIPTTHYDPGVGIARALEKLLQSTHIPGAQIARTVISTTLATNALVEGKGAEVGLFVIGFNKRLDVPAEEVRYIPGGHQSKGIEQEPLGVNYLIDGISRMKGHVQAYGISALMSFVDPSHELVAAKAIALLDDKPVFCSHQASTRPGMKERATTALLNAKLLPVMQSFVAGVKKSLKHQGIGGDVRIVCGDCTKLQLDEAVYRSASTIASGPAATAWYGSQIADTDTALIVDVGGTTTDITLVRNNRPVINDRGMILGNWKTHVTAVEMFTVGVGGDSLVTPLAFKGYDIGPARVVPLSCAADRIGAHYANMFTSSLQWLGPELTSRIIFPMSGTLPEQEDTILTWLHKNGPATPGAIRKSLGTAEAVLEKHLTRLSRNQQIITCGFTPTDALHCLEKLDFGDQNAAMAGAQRLAACHHLSIQDFSQQILTQAQDTIARTILEYVAGREVHHGLAAFLHRRETNSLIDVSVRIKPPIIGIGAGSPFLLPEVAKQLGTTVTFPEHFQVGNAVGAAWLGMHPSIQT